MNICVYICMFVCVCVCFMYVSLSRGRHPLGPETRSAKAEGNIQVTDSEFMCSCPEAADGGFFLYRFCYWSGVVCHSVDAYDLKCLQKCNNY